MANVRSATSARLPPIRIVFNLGSANVPPALSRVGASALDAAFPCPNMSDLLSPEPRIAHLATLRWEAIRLDIIQPRAPPDLRRFASAEVRDTVTGTAGDSHPDSPRRRLPPVRLRTTILAIFSVGHPTIERIFDAERTKFVRSAKTFFRFKNVNLQREL